jgi:hypothetical protein
MKNKGTIFIKEKFVLILIINIKYWIFILFGYLKFKKNRKK